MLAFFLVLYIGCFQVSEVSMSKCDDRHIQEQFFKPGQDLHMWCNHSNMGLSGRDNMQLKSFRLELQRSGASRSYKWIKSAEEDIHSFNITEDLPLGSVWKIETNRVASELLYKPSDTHVHLVVRHASPRDVGLYHCYIKAKRRVSESHDWSEYSGVSQPIYFSLIGQSIYENDYADC
ncbi:uncharacterized protein LOC106070590 isoform X2 [Biomphalaria glabrata]|uniref:Uncharacterized protein LOC106070590 isoform X2 n=1 Tax=Biomphalaria glabrata TaxID=6526 RepID=A0A9W3AP74_BIOGL|nr:uncharacterized protein LOC106070590 isoform X2 [Biomphalaria glabrata]